MEFNHTQIPTLFKNIRIISKVNTYDVEGSYMLNDGAKDIMQITYLGDNEWRFFIDSFPFPKRYYSTNFPIKTTERFISEIKHLGVTIELKESE